MISIKLYVFNIRKNMKNNEFVDIIQKTVGFEITKKELGEIVEAISTVAKEAVLDGDEVTIPGVCKIRSKEVPERTGVTELNGEKRTWTKPAHKEGTIKILPAFKSIFETEVKS